MKVFLCIVFLAFVACSPKRDEKDDIPTKRGLEHRSNLAILNSIQLDNKPLEAFNTNALAGNTIVGNLNIPSGPNVQVTYNPENLSGLAAANAPPFSNSFSFSYAPSHGLPFIASPASTPAFENSVLPFPNDVTLGSGISYGNFGLPLENNTPLSSAAVANNIVPQDTVNVPQAYQVQLTKEVPIPQPYPVPVIKTVQVPVQVKVPVEVPKPYEVRVPHPVPVPVHIKVPVTVEKPYPVQITKTIAVPVEKPIYIRVPQPIEVPVPQPYPVGVPQPVQIRVPVVVRIIDSAGGVLSTALTNLDGTPFQVPDPSVIPAPPTTVNDPATSNTPLLGTPSSLLGTPSPLLATPSPLFTSPLNDSKVTQSTEAPVSAAPSLQPVTGSGLLPPPPPAQLNSNKGIIAGLLNSYVASREGGTYRRNISKYATPEYQKTW